MEIIKVENHSLVPSKYLYKVYQGNLDSCLKSFRNQYPIFDPGTVFYITSINQLWVPMSWKREFDELKVMKL